MATLGQNSAKLAKIYYDELSCTYPQPNDLLEADPRAGAGPTGLVAGAPTGPGAEHTVDRTGVGRAVDLLLDLGYLVGAFTNRMGVEVIFKKLTD